VLEPSAVKPLIFSLAILSLVACDAGRDRSGGGDLSDPPAPADLGRAPFDPDAACATATEVARVDKRPVDIIWVIDNSSSMAPAIAAVQAGLNDFAALVDGKQLDYRIIMVSLRSKTNPIVVSGENRYGVCIPPPLSSGSNCDNGPRFFQSSADIRSTQPLEQLLGTLAQSAGYAQGEARGGEPWQSFLRVAATKTIVVVTDDNSRLSPSQFETFAGGKNPYNTSTLPAGLLHPSWNGLFTDYLFSGIYGWDSLANPSTKCTFGNGTQPVSSGPTYTTLVQKTGGVRAKICDGATQWTGFFDQVAQAVAQAAKLSCNVEIPIPGQGTLDPAAINVTLGSPGGSTTLYKVPNAASCGPAGGWFYDNDAAPTHVVLCPTSCTLAQTQLQASQAAQLQIHFGCATSIL